MWSSIMHAKRSDAAQTGLYSVAFQVPRAQLMVSTFNWSLNKQSIHIAVIELCRSRISCRVGDCVRAEYSYKQV